MDSNEIIIELKNVKFFAFHGLYEEERKVGGHFVVDMTARYNITDAPINHLSETINYEKLHEIVKEEMKEPRDLLETIAVSVAVKAHSKFPQIKEIDIRI